MTDKESVAHAALLVEYRALEEEYSGQDGYLEEVDTRLGELELAMETFEVRPLIIDPREETAVQDVGDADTMGQGADAGVSSCHRAAVSSVGTVITSGGQPIGADLTGEEDGGALKPLLLKVVIRGPEARPMFDEMMGHVAAAACVTAEEATLGGVPGWWVRPAKPAAGRAILYLHGGAYVLGSATAYRNFVGQIVARSGVPAYVADYGLEPERPFLAAIEDARRFIFFSPTG